MLEGTAIVAYWKGRSRAAHYIRPIENTINGKKVMGIQAWFPDCNKIGFVRCGEYEVCPGMPRITPRVWAHRQQAPSLDPDAQGEIYSALKKELELAWFYGEDARAASIGFAITEVLADPPLKTWHPITHTTLHDIGFDQLEEDYTA